jgi:outer membrane protein assembly factor BamD
MIRSSGRCLFIALAWLMFPQICPAPLVYVPGEGWRYEPVGEGGKWVRSTAKDQFEVAKTGFENKQYSVALRAARRTVNVWPFSDYSPEAQYLVGRCLEAKKRDESAFKAYQRLIERYPKLDNYDEIVRRQFEIANRFLAGQWFHLWGWVPLYPSMDKTVQLYEQIIKNGPYSEVAPKAQMNIAVAYTKKLVKDYPAAAQAYEKAADRYNDKPVGTDALFLLGMTYSRQARTAEYDQSVAAQAISTFTDFITLHPTDSRLPQAREMITELRTEQARGSYEIAQFYERKGKWNGALIYYNGVLEVLRNDLNSPYAEQARERIAKIKKRQRTVGTSPSP